MKRALFALAFCLLWILPASAQTVDDTDFLKGFVPYGAYQNSNIDSVNLQTGTLNVTIPLFDYPQRGTVPDLKISLNYYNMVWLVTYVDDGMGGTYPVWSPSPYTGYFAFAQTPTMYPECLPISWPYAYYQCDVAEGNGSDHLMGFTGTDTLETIDASGIRGSNVVSNTSASVTDPNGINYIPQNSWDLWFPKDAVGNTITMDLSTSWPAHAQYSVTDSVSRSIPIPNSTESVTSATQYFPGITGSSNTTVPLTINYAACYGCMGYIQSVTLPNNRTWSFTFDGYGNVQYIYLPTGGYLYYTWNQIFDSYGNYVFQVATRTMNDGTSSKVWAYTYTGTGTQTTVADPDGHNTVHTFISLNPYYSGQYYEKQVDYYQGAVAGTPLKTVETEYAQGPWSLYSDVGIGAYDIVPVQVTTSLDGGAVSVVCMVYDYMTSSPCAHPGSFAGATLYCFGYPYSTFYGYNNIFPLTYGRVVQKIEYDSVGGSVQRHTSTDYVWGSNSNYLNANLLNIPAEVDVTDAGGGPVAKTTYSYDDSGYTPPGSACSSSSPCGYLTTTNNYYSWPGSYVTSHTYYDANGMLWKTIDPNGNPATQYLYDSTGAFLKEIDYAAGFNDKFSYNSNTGLLLSHTDPNSQPTSYTYDTMERLTGVTYPDGGTESYTYNDTSWAPIFDFVRSVDAGVNFEELGYSDGLGRQVKTQTAVPNTTCGGTYSYIVTSYDGEGNLALKSNPECAPSTSPSISYQYDAVGRVTQIADQDGSIQTFSYAGPYTTITDEAGKQRKTKTNGLGQMTDVWEDPSVINYHTTYAYDLNNNLLTATQGAVSRSFAYDILSRLQSATNPESGTTCYGTYSGSTCQANGYDSNGNLLWKTDARGTVTGYSYDVMNRLTQKTYYDGITPSVAYAYDQSNPWGWPLTNTIGRLSTALTSSGGVGLQLGYDAMGRVIHRGQWTPRAVGYDLFANYNYLGGLKTSVNSQGVWLYYTPFDVDGRSTQLTSSLVDSTHPATLISNIYYDTTDVPIMSTLGNGLTQSVVNTPREICRITLFSTGTAPSACGDPSPSGNIQDFGYSYGVWGSTNNGDVTTWVGVGTQSFGRTYTYDRVNRLNSLSDGATSLPCDGLTWSYDQWGNMTAKAQTSGSSACTTWSQAFTNNRINGFSYDAAGNVLNDGSHSYSYDAENRIIAVDGGSTATYVYGVNGERVMKTIGGSQMDYVYGAQGTLSDDVGPMWWDTGYNYFNGKLQSEYEWGSTYFIFSDHLGTTRILTDRTGAVADCYDFLPFGEALTYTGCAGTTGAPATHLFTSKERDAESGLDNFGARYNSSQYGRFMSPDPVFISADRLADPQSLNLYAYVRNNPLSLTDPTGLDFYLSCQHTDDNSDTCQQVQNGSQKDWVQGQTMNGSFQATDVDMNQQGDTSAGYHDQFGNQYTGTFDQNNGVSFTNTATGATSGQSQFIDGSDRTQLNGSGAFANIMGNFFSDCGGSCQGRASLTGTPAAFAATESQLNKQSAFMSALDRLSGAHNAGSQWKDSNGYVHMLNSSGQMEMHFEGHPTGVDIQQFVLHMVDTIRDAASGRAAAEKNTPLP